MISEENKVQIEQYLISKKLQFQLMTEIKDHFISQITYLMDIQSLSFPEAFLETKLSWKNELEMVKADILSFKKITRLERSIMKPVFRKMIGFALIVTLILGIIQKVYESLYFWIQGSLVVVLFGFSLYSFFMKKMKFSEYQRMTFHPLLLRNILIMLIAIPVAKMIFLPKANIWKSQFFDMFLIYAILIQIQLLYFRTKKINVLLSW